MQFVIDHTIKEIQNQIDQNTADATRGTLPRYAKHALVLDTASQMVIYATHWQRPHSVNLSSQAMRAMT